MYIAARDYRGADIFCLTDPGTSITEWFTKFRAGGLSIIGGVCGGALGVVLFCLIHKINFLRVADCLMPCVILAQAVGRWGNFINQEVYGPQVTDPALQWFPFSVFIEDVGEWHYAFFFYESVLDLIIFAILFTLMWKYVKNRTDLRRRGISSDTDWCVRLWNRFAIRSLFSEVR